jgi:serine/threonine protein kinase
MHFVDGSSTILPPDPEPVDEHLTAYLAAPLPEEALARSENKANLFGKYVLLRELGRGATATVVKAWDTYLSRHVALKFLRTTPVRNVEMESTERVQSFLREARLAARLSHPNIVPIHEVDCREGRYYISMEFVDGGTLADVIHGAGDPKGRTRFYKEPERFLTLLRTIALAVHHAHSQTPAVVHRDLKPQNVLLDGKGKPFVADFGLANEVRVEGEKQDGVRGTPSYMAPEQVLGDTRAIDARTDVYALGVILYEMLSGEVPFRGENIPSILRKVVTDVPVPPSIAVARGTKAPPELAGSPQAMRTHLESVCLKALSKKKEERHSSALEFAEALHQWLRPASRGVVTAAPPAPPPRSGKARLVALSSALVLALILGGWRLWSPHAETSAPAAPGSEVSLLASGLLEDGKWPEFRGAVAELRRRAPNHPKLGEFEKAIASREERIEKSRKDWTATLEQLATKADPEDLRRRMAEFSETEDEFRTSLRRGVDRWNASLLKDSRELSGDGPSDAWISADSKKRARSLLQGLETLEQVTRSTGLDHDPASAAEMRARLGKLLAYRGQWTLRANIAPFAEMRILRGGQEIARDFTPAIVKALELNSDDVDVEFFWPSVEDPQKRWKSPLRGLKAGERVVVSGSLESMDIRVERK